MNSLTATLPTIRATRLLPALPLLFAAVATDVAAQSRNVWVNGVRMNDAQVGELSRRQCAHIPDGSYWLNMQTGAWGYAGNPKIQGYLGDAGRQQSAGGGGGRYGPFATLRRAEEEANRYRQQGLRAVAFHNGDGYYVDVRR